jgi:hypothetical protein
MVVDFQWWHSTVVVDFPRSLLMVAFDGGGGLSSFSYELWAIQSFIHSHGGATQGLCSGM